MKKNAIIGLIIGVVLGLSVATYAQTVINYNIQGSIIVPAETKIVLSGIPTDFYGNYVFNDLILVGDTARARFDMSNQGSEMVTITYTATASEPNLNISLEGYIGGSTFGNQFVPGNTVELQRGEHIDCSVIVQDQGAPPGDHSFTLVIEVTG